ncbi:hypothetical protein HanIR_Chr02g0081411 [Helianthus annuus]|nr:hypothetical protein HanIR_Chr02g0081411 [Helianthus annuus]
MKYPATLESAVVTWGKLKGATGKNRLPYDFLMPIKISYPSQPWEVIRDTKRVNISKNY